MSARPTRRPLQDARRLALALVFSLTASASAQSGDETAAFLASLRPDSTAQGPAEHVRARLIAARDAAVPGQKLLVGVHLAHDPAWHTYWRNAGDSGYATTVDWRLPQGVVAGPLQWPSPHEYPDAAGFVTYGYGDDILLLSELAIPADAAGELQLAAQVDWLMCRELCIPDTAQVELMLPVREVAQPVGGFEAELFAAAQARLPQTQLAGIDLAHALELAPIPPGQATRAVLRVRGLNDAASAKWTWFPLEQDAVLPERAQAKIVGRDLLIELPFEIDRAQAGGVELVWGGVLELKENDAPRWLQTQIVLPVASEADAIQANDDPILQAFSGTAVGADAATPQRGFLVFLLFAFVGGAILNVMPCVLPVLSLKVMGFVSHAGESRAAILRLGLLFTLGVLVSFLALALVVIGIQAAGDQLGWGFQFQNPIFVVVMSAIVFAFGLSLFGVYEIVLPIGFGGGSRAHGAGVESFVSGVLATALATPCTAPFLGSALGFAFTQPWYGVLAIFLTVGLGLAAPYMVLAANPGWLRFVPRPGAWMVRFKQGMGFLLMATLIWLLWVLSRQLGAEAVVWTLAFLCALGFGLWMYGAFVNLSSGNSRRLSFLILLVAITAGSAVGFLRGPLTAPAQAAPGAVAHGDWQRFDKAALAAAVSAGQTVFLDFTADWCTTCKVNEKTVLETDEIRAKFEELDVLKMVGDYTRRDPEITQVLRSFGRSGVPLYVVYPAGRLEDPIVLPEVITKSIVLRALEAAGPSRIDTASTLGQSARHIPVSEDER
jgi:thiol:disulfide interchange protein DsbD